MTESERYIEIIKSLDCEDITSIVCEYSKTGCSDCSFMIAKNKAIQALSEIQQYKAIGTVEELKTAMKYVSLAKKHGTTGKAIDACAEFEAIGTVSEFRELKEKATAKKPKKIKRHRGGFEMEHCPNCDTDYQVDRRFEVEEDYCGNCGKLLDSSFVNFCANCGCPVDMSKEKE